MQKRICLKYNALKLDISFDDNSYIAYNRLQYSTSC
jgi:hypothetical protein